MTAPYLLPFGVHRRKHIMRSRLLAVTPWISLAVAAFMACGSPTSPQVVPVAGSGSSTSGSNTANSGTNAATGAGAGVGSGSVATGSTGSGTGTGAAASGTNG